MYVSPPFRVFTYLTCTHIALGPCTRSPQHLHHLLCRTSCFPLGNSQTCEAGRKVRYVITVGLHLTHTPKLISLSSSQMHMHTILEMTHTLTLHTDQRATTTLQATLKSPGMAQRQCAYMTTVQHGVSSTTRRLHRSRVFSSLNSVSFCIACSSA